jgi:stage V sporulation protein AB
LIGLPAAALAALAEGLAVGAALGALVVLLSVGARLARVTATPEFGRAYEWALACGAAAAASYEVWPWTLRGPRALAAILGGGMGIFIGMLAAALAEVVAVMPLLARRLGLVPYLPRLVLALALGKTLGAVAWLLVPGLFSRPPA